MQINRTSIQNLALYFYFFSMNVENFDPFGTGGSFSISKVAGIIYLISILPSFKVFVFFTKRNLHFFWPIIVFFVWLTIISLININPLSSRFLDIAILLNILIFIVIVNHARKDLLVLDKAIYALGIGSLFTAILLYLGIGLELTDEGMRPGRETFLNAGPNELGIKLATGAIILAVMAIKNSLMLNKVHRFVLILFVPLIFFSVLKTGSRTAFLVPLLCGFVWFFFRVLASRYKFLAILTGVFTLLIIFIPLLYFSLQSPELLDRVSRTGGSGDFDELGRFTLWAGFISLLGENPIFGNGLSGFDQITYNFFGFIESPHNVLLEVMLYSGLIGLAIYLVFLYRVIYASYRLFKDNRTLLPALLLPTVAAFTMALQGLSEKTCWLVLAYIVGTYLYNKSNKTEPLTRT